MTASDATNNTSGLLLSDNAQVVNGISGNAIYLAELSYGSLSLGKILSQFSISFWRKWDAITDVSYLRYVFYVSTDFYMYFNPTDGYLTVKFPGKAELKTSIADSTTNNHFCITYKASESIIIYINEVIVYNVVAESLSVDFSTNKFYFGYTTGKAHATFDEIRFYSRPLEMTEVSGLYHIVAKGYSSKTLQAVVATTTAKYVGIGILEGLSIAKFTGATVSDTGVITTGDLVTPNIGDFMINYASTNASLGIYVWSGSLWSTTSDVSKLTSCALDLINLNVGGITVDSYTTYTACLIKSLFAQEISLLTGGSIHSSDFVSGKTGFKINADGSTELNNLIARGSLANGKGFNNSGTLVDTTGNSVYIGDGLEYYTKLVPLHGVNLTEHWHTVGVQATYTAETFTSNYTRVANLQDGYFIIGLSSTTIGLYYYTFGSIQKVVTITLPTSITSIATYDIFAIGGSRSDGWKIGIIDANVIRIYSITYSGTISLYKTITIPVNVRNVVFIGYVDVYDYCFAVESYASSYNSGPVYIYGYKLSDSSLTQLATATPSWTSQTSVTQNMFLGGVHTQINGVTQTIYYILVGKFVLKYNITANTLDTENYLNYSEEEQNNNVSMAGRCCMYNAISFMMDTIYQNFRLYAWREGITNDIPNFNGIITGTTEAPHRLLQISYGTILCVGVNFGGMKVITIAPDL